MATLRVSENRRTLLRDGQPFFWLADTCWSAFTNISDQEWEEYLDLRASQGFNVLQISALPHPYRCGSSLGFLPFPSQDGFRFDFSRMDPLYFDRAAWMCSRAVEKGLTPAIAVLWQNYVSGIRTTAAGGDNVIPEAYLEPILRKIAETFRPFQPVWLLSGDADWTSPEAVRRYGMAADLLSRYAPEGLRAWYMKERCDEVPAQLDGYADLYLYQSGQDRDAQAGAVTLASALLSRSPRKPVLNAGPCFEQAGYSRGQYGRFRRGEIRAAMWNSLLSGACAGITYGANGVWNWQKYGMPRNPADSGGGMQGFEARQAILLPGAWDYSFGRRLFEESGWTMAEPCQETLVNYRNEVRAARVENLLLLYVPTNVPLILHGTYSSCTAVDLDAYAKCDVPRTSQGGKTYLPLHPYFQDALLILEC